MLSFTDLVDKLNHFWSQHGVSIGQPYGMKLGAGTSNPLTALRVLGPEPFNIAYIEPCRRPADGRYGENPNRLQHYFQYQIILKPAPRFNTYLYINMLKAIGIDPQKHDIRFVEDNWESPSLGAWGLGWEVWVDGMEVSQYTYFQQVAGIDLEIPALEITLGLERLAMYLQDVDHYQNIKWDNNLTYKDLYTQHEYWQSKFNYETSNPKNLQTLYQTYLNMVKNQLQKNNYWAAYDNLLELSHVFNLLDAKGLISATDRVAKFKHMAQLANQIAKSYLHERHQLGYPLKKVKPITYDLPSISITSDSKTHDNLYILELGFEEIPAPFLSQFFQKFNKSWLVNYLNQHYPQGFKEAKFYLTPQRLVIYLEKVKKTLTYTQTITGPATKVAFDANQKPTPILYNFLKKHNLTLKDIQIKNQKVIAEKNLTVKLQDIIQDIVNQIISYEVDTKYMRWDNTNHKFIRPLRWIVSLLDNKVIPVQALGVTADRFTLTPRYVNPQLIRLDSAQAYQTFINKYNIVLSPYKRQQAITNNLPPTANIKKNLLIENIFLTESPHVVIHQLPPKYQKLPPQLVFDILETHQRYLVFGHQNQINYAIVINHADPDKVKTIAASNAKVVTARLDDGLFYLQKDLKKDLKTYRKDLDKIIYHPQIGTYLDKIKRLTQLAPLVLDTSDPDIKTILDLIKNDKATLSGKEFPELEGVIGAHIAKLQKYPKKIYQILSDYVLPVPKTSTGQKIALIDIIDDIAALSSLHGLPKGNTDPYHLRSKTKRLIKIASLIDLDLQPILSKALKITNNSKVNLTDLVAYLNKRFVAFLRSQTNLPHHLIQPVVNANHLNLYQKTQIAKQLAQLDKNQQDLIFDATKRIYNIINQANFTPKQVVDINPNLFTTSAEKTLYAFWQEHKSQTPDIKLLTQLAYQLENFFDSTFVMDKDPKIKLNRLSLLYNLYTFINQIFKYQ